MPESQNPFDLIPEYALGVLADDERAQVDALLARSAEARAELAAFESTLLGLTVLTTAARQAPEALTTNFTAWLRSPDSSALVGQPAAAATPDPGARRVNPQVVARQPVRRVFMSVMFAAAAMLLLVIAISTISGGLLDLRTLVPTSDIAQRQITEILDDPEMHRYPIAFVAAGSKAGGTLYANRENTKAVLEVAQLGPAPDGADYQVWLLNDGVPHSAGVFNVQSTQYPTRILITAPDPLTNYQLLALSVEPDGGSKQPTTQPFATAKLE
jgi:anti-sigma-K factor RskA